jgi:hypothetical protein
MEPITLCGLVIVGFGLWVEFEPAVKALVKTIRGKNLFKDVFAQREIRHPAYERRIPTCLAKHSHY